MKKALSLILVIAMVVCLIPAVVVSAKTAPTITLDGALGDWAGLDKLTLVGKDETADKSVSFYGYRAENGLYLACEAVHLKLITDRGNWWENNNFEVFLWNNENERSQYWVRTGLDGETVVPVKSDNVTDVALTCVKDTDTDHYKTIIEVYIANEQLPSKQQSAEYLPLGCAWKINNGAGEYEDIKGGGANEYDSYWVLPHTWPAMCSLIATNSGIYTGYDHWGVDNGTFISTGRIRWSSFNTFKLGSADEVTLSGSFKVARQQTEPENNGADHGFLVGAKDLNGDGQYKEGDDLYYLVDIRTDGTVGIERNNKGWGGWNAEGGSAKELGDTVDVKVVFTKTDKVNIKVYIDGSADAVIDYTDNEPLDANDYALASKVTNDEINNVKVNDATPDLPKQEIPKATYGNADVDPGDNPNPGTGDAAVIAIAAVMAVSLAAVAVAASKRRIAE